MKAGLRLIFCHWVVGAFDEVVSARTLEVSNQTSWFCVRWQTVTCVHWGAVLYNCDCSSL